MSIQGRLNLFRGIAVQSLKTVRNFSRTMAAHSADKIDVNVQNGIRKVVINRPEAKNALSYEVYYSCLNACNFLTKKPV